MDEARRPSVDRVPVVGLLSLLGGALILAGAATGVTGLLALFRGFGVATSSLLGFAACTGASSGLLGGFAIWMGLRSVRGHPTHGTALGLVGMAAIFVSIVGMLTFIIGWVLATFGGFLVLISAVLAKASE